MTAVLTADEERLLTDLRPLGDMVRGPGMSTQLRGDQLNGLLNLVDRLRRAETTTTGSWTDDLVELVAILVDIIESGEDCKVNAADALARWSDRNKAPLDAKMLAAFNRALSGGGT